MSLILGSDRYRVLADHFQSCSELGAADREKYLSAVPDEEIRKELRSLLKFHSASLELPTPNSKPLAPASGRDSRVRRKRRRSTTLAILSVAGALTALGLAGGAWTLARVDADLR